MYRVAILSNKVSFFFIFWCSILDKLMLSQREQNLFIIINCLQLELMNQTTVLAIVPHRKASKNLCTQRNLINLFPFQLRGWNLPISLVTAVKCLQLGKEKKNKKKPKTSCLPSFLFFLLLSTFLSVKVDQ